LKALARAPSTCWTEVAIAHNGGGVLVVTSKRRRRHCRSGEEAQALWNALEVRLAACRLVLHPQKTRLVYCKDTNRRGDFPNQSFDFLGYAFRPRKAVWRGGRSGVSFLPAASPKALKAMRQAIRGWAMHRRSDKTLDDLARMHNPYVRGWINYYSHFYRSALYWTLNRVDAVLVRWACDKFKHLRRKPRRARDWLARVRRGECPEIGGVGTRSV